MEELIGHLDRPAIDIISCRGPLSVDVLLPPGGERRPEDIDASSHPPPAISPVPRPDLIEQGE